MLNDVLQQIRLENSLPAAAAAYFDTAHVFEPVVCGVRSVDDNVEAQTEDLWHFGSVGKSFTASVMAILALRGNLRFDCTLTDFLPEAEGTPYQNVTISQMLSHRSGIATNPSTRLLLKYLFFGGDPFILSLKMKDRLLKKRPKFKPGEDFLYSNAAYGLAGMVAERASGYDFQTLMRHFVLHPAGCDATRFGVPPQDGGAPYEHKRSVFLRNWKRASASTRAVDDIPMLQPSGCLSGPIADLARYGQWQMNNLLASEGGDAEILKIPFQPIGKAIDPKNLWRYGMGWFVGEAPHNRGRMIWHAGSTGGSYAFLALYPDASRGFCFTTNCFDPRWTDPRSEFLLQLETAVLQDQK